MQEIKVLMLPLKMLKRFRLNLIRRNSANSKERIVAEKRGKEERNKMNY